MVEEVKQRRLGAHHLLGALFALAVCLAFAPSLALGYNGAGLYGEISADGTTLTYKYGKNGTHMDEDGGMWLADEGDAPPNVWIWTASQAEKLTCIVFAPSVKDFKAETLKGLINEVRYGSDWREGYYKNVRTVEGLGNLNTSECTVFDHMLDGCDSITSLDLSTFDTSKCTSMKDMLSCDSLRSLKLGKKFKFVPQKNDAGLPGLIWRSSNNGYRLYYGEDIPSNVADTYIGEANTGAGDHIEKDLMFRLYNPNSGEHFYTASHDERDHLVSVGWTWEGTGWMAPKKSTMPVYRLYNANAGDHHYTMSAYERDSLVAVGWNYEGIGWYSCAPDELPLYRQYNPNAIAGSHNYTLSKNENDTLVGLGWRAEGIAWYGFEVR